MSKRAAESQIKTFLAKYSPDVRKQLQGARAHLRDMFPRGFELVYDNYNALVFGFASTERSSDAFLSVAGYPKWVNLFFLNGVDLKDPKRLLQGAGVQVRSIRLQSAGQVLEADVQALIAQAIKPYRKALDGAGPLQTLIKSVSAKQRSRRPRST